MPDLFRHALPPAPLAGPKTAALASPSRRLFMVFGLAGAGGLAGCGFKLSQPPRMAFRTVVLTGFAPDSPLATELALALEASGVRVVDSTAQAAGALAPDGSPQAPDAALLSRHVILESLSDNREQVVASSTAFGQVRDMSLRTRFRFRLLRADGSVLLPPTELALGRDATFNEKDALAKQAEFEALHRAMQSDLVGQTLRRLAVVQPDQLARP